MPGSLPLDSSLETGVYRTRLKPLIIPPYPHGLKTRQLAAGFNLSHSETEST